jgi:hypothetical protein
MGTGMGIRGSGPDELEEPTAPTLSRAVVLSAYVGMVGCGTCTCVHRWPVGNQAWTEPANGVFGSLNYLRITISIDIS